MLLSVLTGVLLGGCGSGDTCATARNGTCEELVGCPLGTDSTDCDQACSTDPWTSGVEAACAHDRAADPPAEVEE
ncbi:MAG: hypothetical protein QGG40_21755, partial [Myxococcota bacterium]|nr:hypothetical protein [Myxococcota bacterium]